MKYKRREEGNRETIGFFLYGASLSHTHTVILIQTDRCAAGDSGKKEVQSV